MTDVETVRLESASTVGTRARTAMTITLSKAENASITVYTIIAYVEKIRASHSLDVDAVGRPLVSLEPPVWHVEWMTFSQGERF